MFSLCTAICERWLSVVKYINEIYYNVIRKQFCYKWGFDYLKQCIVKSHLESFCNTVAMLLNTERAILEFLPSHVCSDEVKGRELLRFAAFGGIGNLSEDTIK